MDDEQAGGPLPPNDSSRLQGDQAPTDGQDVPQPGVGQNEFATEGGEPISLAQRNLEPSHPAVPEVRSLVKKRSVGFAPLDPHNTYRPQHSSPLASVPAQARSPNLVHNRPEDGVQGSSSKRVRLFPPESAPGMPSSPLVASWQAFSHQISRNPKGHVQDGSPSHWDGSDRVHPSPSIRTDQLEYTPPDFRSRNVVTEPGTRSVQRDHPLNRSGPRRYSRDSVEQLYAEWSSLDDSVVGAEIQDAQPSTTATPATGRIHAKDLPPLPMQSRGSSLPEEHISLPDDQIHPTHHDDPPPVILPAERRERTGPIKGTWRAIHQNSNMSVALQLELEGAIPELVLDLGPDLSPRGSPVGSVSDDYSILSAQPTLPDDLTLSAREHGQSSSVSGMRTWTQEEYLHSPDSLMFSMSTVSSVSSWNPSLGSGKGRSARPVNAAAEVEDATSSNLQKTKRATHDVRGMLAASRADLDACFKAVTKIRSHLYPAERRLGQSSADVVCSSLWDSLSAVKAVFGQIELEFPSKDYPTKTETTWLQKRRDMLLSLQRNCLRLVSLERKIARRDLTRRASDICQKIEQFDTKIFDIYIRLAISHHILHESHLRARLREYRRDHREDIDPEVLRQLGARIRKERTVIDILRNPKSPRRPSILRMKIDEAYS